MDLKRVTRIEQSVHNLLADPEANHLTKPQQKEWKAIDVALQHLMQKMKGNDQGGQQRSAPPQSSFSATQAPAATTSQVPSPPQPAPPQSAPMVSSTDGVEAPTWAETQGGATGDTAISQGIEDQSTISGNSSLDSMLYELEMALKAAQEERNAARHGKHGKHDHGVQSVQAHTMSATSTGKGQAPQSLARVDGAQGGIAMSRDGQRGTGKSNPDDIMGMGDVAGYHTSNYGKELGDNKKMIIAALDEAGATPKEKALVMAMFMQETNHMAARERDPSKDHLTDGSANVSALNMNLGMVKGGYNDNNPGLKNFDPSVDLNDPANVGKAAVLCLDGFREFGVPAWIAGQRGGYPAAQRQQEFGTAITGSGDKAYFKDEFYDPIAIDYQAILKDPSLLTDDRRVERD